MATNAHKTALAGKDLMLWIDNSVIPLSTSCQLSISTSSSDAATKDDGIFDAQIPETVNWSVTNDSQLCTSAAALNTIRQAMLNLTKVTIIFGVVSNADNAGVDGTTGAGAWVAPSTGCYTGDGYISSLTEQGDKGSKGSLSITINGAGKLTYTPGT